MHAYRCDTVVGDRWGGTWPAQEFLKSRVGYKSSERNRSDLYVGLLPMLNARAIDLLDQPRLVAQLCGLERSTSRGGKDSIDHRRGSHDDLAGVAYITTQKRRGIEYFEGVNWPPTGLRIRTGDSGLTEYILPSGHIYEAPVGQEEQVHAWVRRLMGER